MKNEQRVYIKGSRNRGAKVIKALTDLGGINSNNFYGISEKSYYYISPTGIIMDVDCHDKAIMSLLKECYTEIKFSRWKPKYREYYFYIASNGIVKQGICNNTAVDDLYYEFGNCFKTYEGAEAMRNRIKEILNKYEV